MLFAASLWCILINFFGAISFLLSHILSFVHGSLTSGAPLCAAYCAAFQCRIIVAFGGHPLVYFWYFLLCISWNFHLHTFAISILVIEVLTGTSYCAIPGGFPGLFVTFLVNGFAALLDIFSSSFFIRSVKALCGFCCPVGSCLGLFFCRVCRCIFVMLSVAPFSFINALSLNYLHIAAHYYRWQSM